MATELSPVVLKLSADVSGVADALELVGAAFTSAAEKIRSADEPQRFDALDYEDALLEIKAALQSMFFAAPEMMPTHMERMRLALDSVGIEL